MRFTLAPARERPTVAPGAVPVPDAIEVTGSAVILGVPDLDAGEWACTLAVVGYPAEVEAGWWQPLLTWPGRLDVAVHIEPIPPAVAAQRLRRSRARMESARYSDSRRGRPSDPAVEAAAEDAEHLASRVARGDGRLYSVGVYLTVRADNREELADAVGEVRAVCGGMLLQTVPVTWRQLQGLTASLPVAVDRLMMRRVLDTDALASFMPFGIPDLALPPAATEPAGSGRHSGLASSGSGAVFYGFNLAAPSPVVWDRWRQPNHNAVVLAQSGAGKSYLAKVDLVGHLIRGGSASVLDPDGEYVALAEAFGGTVLTPGTAGASINPFDLADHRPDALARRILFAQTLIEVLVGAPLSAGERGAWDQAVRVAYAVAGFTDDPASWRRPGPLLGDVVAALAAVESEHAVTLTTQLGPYVDGAYRAAFAHHTTVAADPGAVLVVYDLHAMPDELSPVGMLVTLDAIWGRLTDPSERHRRKVAVVDEAWRLLGQPAGAQFLHRAARASRKHLAGLTVVTQDVDDVLATAQGRAVITNASTQLLMKQAPQTLPALAAAFGLSGAEGGFLATAQRGEALLAAGERRVMFRAMAPEHLHPVLVTGADHT